VLTYRKGRCRRIHKAIADYDAALKTNPKLAGPLYGRGMAKLRKGEVPAAMLTSPRRRKSTRLPRHQFQRRAAQQSRDNRHLALNRKTLGAIPVDARMGAYASFGGALRHPFGLAPVIIRHV
jgi:hypothetical protein